MRDRFLRDLKIVYGYIEDEQRFLQKFYEVLKTSESDEGDESEHSIWLLRFLKALDLPVEAQSKMAAATRIVSLREDMLVQYLKEKGFLEEEIVKIKEKAYLWVADFYIERFEKLLGKIESNRLLSPFYRELLKGAHRVGKAFSKWQTSWHAQIIEGTNRELYRLFNGDEERIFEMINQKELFDPNEEGAAAERSYSVLVYEDGEFVSKPYAVAFEEEVDSVCSEIESLLESIENLKDEVFRQHKEWIDYFRAVLEALREKKRENLIKKWSLVDTAWMRITVPIQIGHPLEYYEDRYKRAVALEWDVRISDPSFEAEIIKRETIKGYEELYGMLGCKNKELFEISRSNIKKTQLYIGRPFSWYGAEFNGLFSAQVVPNDEKVSFLMGKKIFAYADMVFESQKNRPRMRIKTEIFGKEKVKRFGEIFKSKDRWMKIYEISTIGHEFGHIMWIDQKSEISMNNSGEFKNVEEFKATAGGLALFFVNEQEQFIADLIDDLVQRAVGLISWMETQEVMPYYIEALIHLTALFESGVVDFEDIVEIDYSNYPALKEWYLKNYGDLVLNFYEPKRDPSAFLRKFVSKEGSIYMPINKKVRDFVRYYWDLYKKIGRDIEE